MNKTTLGLLIFAVSVSHFVFAAESTNLEGAVADDQAPGLTELTRKEIEQYEFDIEESEVTVKDLSLGQRYALSTQRRELHDLIARTLGVLELKEDRTDIKVLQNLVNRKEILTSNIRGWQSFGIVFGDVLAKEFGLSWVAYEDEFGTSKALRWRKTENYVFPVTMFSKRNQFNEKIDVQAVFDKLEGEVEAFKEFELNRPEFE